MTRKQGPVLIEIDEEEAPGASPADAPPVPDLDAPAAEGRAMQTAATLAARRGGRLGAWFWGLLLAFVATAVSLAAWDFVTGLIARLPVLGWTLAGMGAAILVLLAVIVVREAAAIARLGRIDRLQREADAALAGQDLDGARAVIRRLEGLYRQRPDTGWARARLAEREAEMLDADALLGLAEAELLAPLDAAARREIEAAARQVAAITAIVPLALADVIGALTANTRMIRRIADIYGGRSGTLGSLRLLRAVFTHLVATGAVAVGDDMLSSIAGGGLVSRLSRRFGEGVVNGALTARVGVAALEVCRPLPFRRLSRPSVSSIVKRALTGLFASPR